MFNIGPNESLIAALDRHYDPEDRRTYVPIDIRREYVHSTTGLNTPTDFGSIDYSPMAQEALYLAAHCAFQDIPVDHIWNIWAVLTELALEKQRYPLQKEVREAIYAVLQEKADPIIHSPAFQEMQPGDHVVAFQTGNAAGNTVLLRSFSARKNPDFGLQQTPEGFRFHDVVLACSDTYSPRCRICFDDHSGHRIPNAQGQGKFQKGSYRTSFAKEAKHLTTQHGQQGEEFLKTVGSIVMDTAGLPPIKLWHSETEEQ